MDFLTLAKKRYSVRKYSSRKVEPEKLNLILEAARVAPTGANFQPQKLLVVQSDVGLSKLAKATNTFHSPLAIIVLSDKNTAWVRPFDQKNITDIDATIITDHMMHEATDLNLATVWVCGFNPDILRSEFQIPNNYEIVNILVIGYSQETPLSSERHTTTRKPLSEIVVHETF